VTPQAYAARLADRIVTLGPDDWTIEQTLAVLNEHMLLCVRYDDGRWAARVSHTPGDAQEEGAFWCVGATLQEALQLAVLQLAGGEA
jgi:hypothetical protein